MNGDFDGSQISDNAELQSGSRPSKKARKSKEFKCFALQPQLDDAQLDSKNSYGAQFSPVAGQGSAAHDVQGFADVCANDGAEGCNFKQMVFIELCAGSANLSSVAQKFGYRVMPVDHKRNRHKPKCHIVELDLATDHAWDVLTYIVETCDVAAIHLAPPCGTCSNARGIPLPNGDPGPQVLRTVQFPLGVPNMSAADRTKVDAANDIYKRTGPFLQWLTERGAAWIPENPTNSFLWQLEFFKDAVENGYFAHCHACAWGSSRKKKTSFLSNRPNISLMEKLCEDVPPHRHEEWGVDASGGFAAALEAEYPVPMCEQLVKVVDEICAEMNIQVSHAGIQAPRVHHQPRGRATPQLIPEFEHVVTLLLREVPVLDSKRCITTEILSNKICIPVGSKLLRSEKKGKLTLCVFGVFHSCEKFVSIARSLWHPFDLAAHMPDFLLKCLFEHLTCSPTELVKLRISRLKQWTGWAADLSKDELKYKATLDPGVRSALGSKRLLLMQKIAEQIGWPDTELFDEFASGFRIVGNATRSHVFQVGLKAASLSEAQLMSDAKFLKPALLGKIKSGGAGEHAAELYQLTLKSWLGGLSAPLTLTSSTM